MPQDATPATKALYRSKAAFDPDWYVAQYDDVAPAIASGGTADAWAHYVTIGRPAGRPPCAFDEAWYLDKYLDVGRAIEKGAFASALHHYLNAGRREGRLPVPPQAVARVFAYGSFGSNNVGDEAILEGVKRAHPGCIQIHLNKPRTGPGFFPNQILQRPGFFTERDHLILGGGGLLYDRETIRLMIDLAKSALAAGAVVDIQRIGCEAARDDYADEIRELFALARHASVRSTRSQAIIERITGTVYPVEFDFAFNLTEDVRAIPRVLHDVPTIGVATASMDDAQTQILAGVIGDYLRANRNSPVRFVHVPHSRSYFNLGNNDHLTGEKLWVFMGMQSVAHPERFELRQYDPEPLSVLATYRRFDGILSSRYHGLIFGKIAETPTLAMARNVKLLSFLEDHASDTLFSAKDVADVAAQLPDFVAFVLTHRQAAEADAMRV